MALDSSKINLRPTRRSKETDPQKIFNGLTLRGSIENIWGPQLAALSQWHENRSDSDSVIEMNTGGGKTLVGLLIAQSLVNETGKGVLYVCPTNQLVEQAYRRADECGIETALYMGGSWQHRGLYDGALAPCLTNYASLFNGRSIFHNSDLGGVIFDDAHVAGSVIRSQFTLSFPSDEETYQKLAEKLQSYFAANRLGQTFKDVLEGDPRPLLFVPMFETLRLAPVLSKILIEQGVEEDKKTKFAWEYLKDHLDRCVVLMSGSRIEISPPALPLHRLKCLTQPVRRIYLTATLPWPAEFIKTFGVTGSRRIAPKGKSGEAQRLLILPQGDDDDEQRETAKELIQAYKACIIVPSSKAAEVWEDISTQFDPRSGHSGIEEFSNSKEDNKLTLAARYDGIDLPGDACRVLVIDGLPKGTHLLMRFLDENIQVQSLRASHTAVRMVQAIGRIFRSNTDHGAVILCGVEVQGWARRPANLAFLPTLLQKQLQLGFTLRENTEQGETTYTELLTAILSGDREWDKIYRRGIESFESDSPGTPPSWLATAAIKEQQAYQRLWEGNFQKAAEQFKSLADETDQHDAFYAAWFRHWEGFAYELNTNRTQALVAYTKAANARSELGRPRADKRSGLATGSVPTPSRQARSIADIATKRKVNQMLESIERDLKYGKSNDPSGPAEEALRILGTLLGLESTRPDKEERTGPDVYWRDPSSKIGAALEAKTNKAEQSQYQKKDDIGQFHDHMAYLHRKHPEDQYRKFIVGRLLHVTNDCHPPDDLRIVPVEAFHDLVSRVKELYQYIHGPDNGEAADVVAERWLEQLGLKWPACLDGLSSKLAVDLQADTLDANRVD